MRPTGVVPQSLARPLALGGLLVFFGALLYFAYDYMAVFGRDVRGPALNRAIATDVLLFSIFALHHSLFARDAFRKLVTRSVGVLERSFYVWAASLLFIAVCALWRPVAGVVWRIDQPVAVWLARAAQVGGVVLTLRSAFLIDIRELSGLRQVDTAGRILHVPSGLPEFTTQGPYGWVRHPIYAGWFLMTFSVPLMTMTRFVFACASSVYLLIAIPLEERSLRRSSKGGYDQYMRQVRWKLVPWVY